MRIYKLRRFYNTIKYLKLIQLRYQLFYKYKKVTGRKNNFVNQKDQSGFGKNIFLEKYIDKISSFINCQFNFLNKEVVFDSADCINWTDNRHGLLWTYNLNYMDYILQANISKKDVFYLIKSFILSFPDNKNGLEPYPTSLRCINWVKFISTVSQKEWEDYSDVICREEVDSSLYAQYLVLLDNLEYHLLGNHLLENGFSLLFGAYYFRENLFYEKAEKILYSELNEQVLSDGAHFELSPMYHQIILDRLLDSINLIKNNSWINDELLTFLTKKASKMLGWMEQITFSNGDIPMVNDSAYGIAPDSKKLQQYAQQLGVVLAKEKLCESGYRMFKTNCFELFIDCGQIGPNYQPGHSHSDIGNFVFYNSKRPFIIDTGVSTYENCKIRLDERSTMAHNVVGYDGINQADVWGGFRVGARPRVEMVSDDENFVHIRYKCHTNKKYIHERIFEIVKGKVIIKDSVTGKINKGLLSYIHFAPNITPILSDNKLLIDDNQIVLHGYKSIVLEEYQLAVGFNKTTKSTMLKAEVDNKSKIEIFRNK